jgi:hypothetical protein
MRPHPDPISPPGLLETCRRPPSSPAGGQVRRHFQELLSGSSLRAYTSADLVGVELGGVPKNVYAVAAGLSDGLGFGDSSKASLIVHSLHELVKVATALGADSATINGLAGAGDLTATSFTRLSPNRMAGEATGRGRGLLSFKPASVASLRDSQRSRLLQKSLNRVTLACLSFVSCTGSSPGASRLWLVSSV